MNRYLAAVFLVAACGGEPIPPDGDDPACKVADGRVEVGVRFADASDMADRFERYFVAVAEMEPFSGDSQKVAEFGEGDDVRGVLSRASGSLARLSVQAEWFDFNTGERLTGADTHDFVLERNCDYLITVGSGPTFAYGWRSR